MARIYLLHLTEATAGTRPTTWLNSVPGGPAFLNKGNLGDTGAVSEVSGTMPFGAGAFTQSGGSNRTTITSATQVTFTGDFTMQGFTGSPLEGSAFIAQFSTNGTDGGAMRIQLLAIDEGGGSFSFLCFAQQVANSGFFAFQTAAIAPSTVAGVSGYHWALQREGDYLTFRCNGSLRATATTPLTGALTGYIDPFGAYEQASGGCGGEAQIRISELAGDDTAVYTGSTYTVPTSRFADPGGGGSPTTATAAAGSATVSGAGRSIKRGTGTAAAGIATVSAGARASKRTTATAAAGVATPGASGRALATTVATAAAGVSIVAAAGAAQGVATAVPADGVATVPGLAAASWAAASAIPANGIATVSAVGGNAAPAQASPVPAAGQAAVSAQSAALAAAAGSAAGAVTVAGVGASRSSAAVVPAAGLSSTAATGSSLAAAVPAAAAGAATAGAVGGSGTVGSSSAIPASGSATVSGSGRASAFAAVAASAGVAAASAVASVLAAATAAAAGMASCGVSGRSSAAAAAAPAQGTAVVSAVGIAGGLFDFFYSERVLLLPPERRFIDLEPETRTVLLRADLRFIPPV